MLRWEAVAFRAAPESLVRGKYRLVRCLADGGMGSVWQAKHVALDADVAVKLMSPLLTDTPSATARFEREAKASAQLKSPHIVKVQDYGVEDATPFMVMELLSGEDLGDVIARDKRLPLARMAHIAAQICKALKVAHAAGIVHRDLKPSNVFLAREGDDEVVKLVDFGIARETGAKLVDEKTSSGVVLGSPHHMSPEQARGEPVDLRSDLWSLGVLLFRAITGKRPFEGETMATVLLRVVSQPPPRATHLCPDLPPDVDRFFERALAREVDQRFASAADLSGALSAIAGGRDPSTWLALKPVPRASRGREEATLDESQSASIKVAAVSTPGTVEPTSATMSRELTGLERDRSRRRLRRAVPWIGLALALGAAGFLMGRTRSDTPAASATSSALVGASSLPLPVPPAAASVPSASAEVKPSTPPPPVASSIAPRPMLRPRPAKQPAVDPFTGLPL
jgi:serine/threonine-protein kinase